MYISRKECAKDILGRGNKYNWFLQNQLPLKVVKDQIPLEAWYGYIPLLNFLKVFCCLCFTYVPQVKHDKLDEKAVWEFLLGTIMFQSVQNRST